MDKHCVEVRMQLQKHNLLEMAVIDVGQNVKQKSMNFSYFFYKTWWKFIAWKLRKNENIKFQVKWNYLNACDICSITIFFPWSYLKIGFKDQVLNLKY